MLVYSSDGDATAVKTSRSFGQIRTLALVEAISSFCKRPAGFAVAT